MKRYILAVYVLVASMSCFAQELHYEAIRDTLLLDPNINYFAKKVVSGARIPWTREELYDNRIGEVEKGEKVTYRLDNSYTLFGYVEGGYVSLIEVTTSEGRRGKVILDDLAPIPDNVLTSDVITDYAADELWVCSHYYDVLASASREKLLEHAPHWSSSVDPYPSSVSITERTVYMKGYDFSWAEFLITSWEYSGDDIKLEVFLGKDNISVNSDDIFFARLAAGFHKFLLKKDGDYLELYVDEQAEPPLMTFVKPNDYVNFWRGIDAVHREEKPDLSTVTFPRHADGTSDYGFVSAAPSVPAVLENHEVNDIYRVTEELWLRGAQSMDSGGVITNLAAGTEVLMVWKGKVDTINGITSNWVQVKVLSGTKDRDGKPITVGSPGWIFGGYLEPIGTAPSPAPTVKVSHEDGGTYRIVENLRLRESASTGSGIITTLEAGTLAIVLDTGRKETIDGITSNWLRVRTEDGREGWCFGGYVSAEPLPEPAVRQEPLAVEDAVVEVTAPPAETDSSASPSEPSEPPLLVLAVGVAAALAVVAAAVVAVRRRRK